MATVTIAGIGDLLEVNGTNNSDTFNFSGTGVQILNSTAGFVTPSIKTTGVASLDLRGLDGDDHFNGTGTLAPYAIGVTIDAGNPSASDALNLTGATGAVKVDWATDTVTGYGAPVVMIGVETLNADAGSNSATVSGTTGNDAFDATPTGTDAATFKLVSSNPAIGSTPVVNLTNVGATLTADGVGGTDSLTVNGTAGPDSFNLSRNIGALSIGRLGTQVITPTSQFVAWTVKAGDGGDVFNINEPVNGVVGIELNLDGGTGSNSLTYTTVFTTTYVPAGGNNGSITGAAPVNFTNVGTAAVNVGAPATAHRSMRAMAIIM